MREGAILQNGLLRLYQQLLMTPIPFEELVYMVEALLNSLRHIRQRIEQHTSKWLKVDMLCSETAFTCSPTSKSIKKKMDRDRTLRFQTMKEELPSSALASFVRADYKSCLRKRQSEIANNSNNGSQHDVIMLRQFLSSRASLSPEDITGTDPTSEYYRLMLRKVRSLKIKSNKTHS